MIDLKGKTILYVWKDSFPWDIRVDKICSSLKNAGAKVIILARYRGEKLQREFIQGIEVVRVGFGIKSAYSLPVPFNPIWRKHINSAIDEFAPDLIIVREIMLAEDAGAIAHKRKIPIVMDMAEHYPAAMREWKKYNSTLISRFAVHTLKIPDIVEKRSLNYMDGVIVVCREQIERLEACFNYDKSNVSVVHNTPNLHLFKVNEDKNIESPIVFGHHGYMTAEKSLKNLILGFDLAANDLPNIKLKLAGSGECFDDYVKIVGSLKNKSRIELTGEYSYDELPNILNSFDVGVVPYQNSDFNNYTIHNKIFDYFALGKPVLVSSVKPLKRIVDETKAGIVGDFSSPELAAQAIKKMISEFSYDFAKNSIKAAINKYNWEKDSEEMIKFITKFLN